MKSNAKRKTFINNMITYGMVVAAYIIMQVLVGTGHISSLMKGLLVPFCIYVIMAVSLNLTVGILGELSLGHAGFMCVGAFAGALFSKCMKGAIDPTLGMVIAILIGRFGYRMKLVTYTTTSANMMLREIGLVLFLASVGIKAGAGFWDTVVQGDGLKYVGCGFLITVIPILIIGTIARLKFKFNYFTIMGMLAGTYTDPPALAYANASCSKEAPAVGYSTVYPLSMFLRIFTAQIVVLFFCGA